MIQLEIEYDGTKNKDYQAVNYDRDKKEFVGELSTIEAVVEKLGYKIDKIPTRITIRVKANGHTKEFELGGYNKDREGEILTYNYYATDKSGFRLTLLND